MREQVKSKVETYQASEKSRQLVLQTPLLLVAGTAGSGKDTIIQKLLETDKYEYIISHTTREPRKNAGVSEKSSDHYYFVDWQTMSQMLEEQRFIEAKTIHQNNVYGTSVNEIQKIKDSGKIGVTDIDVQGVNEYIKLNHDIKAVFLLPPSHDEWMHRLAIRGSQDQDELRIRLESAEIELEHALKVGYFHFVINASLDKAVSDIRAFAEDDNFQGGDDSTRVEHAWHVLGELKSDLNS